MLSNISLTDAIRKGEEVAGDSLSEDFLRLWYSEESEAFADLEMPRSVIENDVWYAYGRFINRVFIDNIYRKRLPINGRVLFIGPASGVEVEAFLEINPAVDLVLMESSEAYRKILSLGSYLQTW